MITFEHYYLLEYGNASGYSHRVKNGPDILSIGEPLGRNPGGFLGDGSTNREPSPNPLLIKKKRKKKRKNKIKKLDAQNAIDPAMTNKPTLNWT